MRINPDIHLSGIRVDECFPEFNADNLTDLLGIALQRLDFVQ
jgi:hypothetical protein